MAETVNQASANSIFQQPADSKVPQDGTGTHPRGPCPTLIDDSPGVLQLDPWLEPFQDALKRRYSKAQQWIKDLQEHEGGLEKFSRVSRLVPA